MKRQREAGAALVRAELRVGYFTLWWLHFNELIHRANTCQTTGGHPGGLVIDNILFHPETEHDLEFRNCFWNREIWSSIFEASVMTGQTLRSFLSVIWHLEWSRFNCNITQELRWTKQEVIIVGKIEQKMCKDADESTFSARVKIFLWSTPPNWASTLRYSSSKAWQQRSKLQSIKNYNKTTL